MVDSTLMIRDRIDLISSATIALQNEKAIEHDNVYIQRIIDMGVSKVEGRKGCLAGKAPRTFNQILTGTLNILLGGSWKGKWSTYRNVPSAVTMVPNQDSCEMKEN